MLLLDYVILGSVSALAVGSLVFPSKRRLRVVSIFAMALLATFYTVLRPGARAALAYHQSKGGVWSEEWLAGVESYLAVTRHDSAATLLLMLLLTIMALRSK